MTLNCMKFVDAFMEYTFNIVAIEFEFFFSAAAAVRVCVFIVL